MPLTSSKAAWDVPRTTLAILPLAPLRAEMLDGAAFADHWATAMLDPPRYDAIGHDYTRTRQEDPRFLELIVAALGNARTVVNVGAGAGSYEPRDRFVIAIEPSDVMVAQRPREIAQAVRA